ncbi:hypothetical protein KAU11_09265 [Candidatus Babeliales bacterium]|nr:hypothetical protein [Candidatus Babeliales bacterium]
MKRSKYFVISLLIFWSLVSCTKETTSPNNGLMNPTNLVITLIENDLVKLNWNDNSTTEITFSIDKKIGEGDWFVNYNEVAENITTFNDQIPTNTNTVYSYRIRAFDGNDYSDYSNNVGWFSYNSAPSNLSLEQITQDSIKINWQDNSFGEEGFSLDRKIGTEEWISNYKIIEQNETQFTDHSNSLNEVSYYRISAFSGSSNSLSIYDSVQVILPSPTNLDATVVDDNKIRLDWIDNSITEEGFKIERKRTLEDYEIIAEVNENITSYIDENVEIGITYYYRIYAFTQEVQSNYSNEIAASITQIELWVPEIYPTIQSAINAANDDELVLVHPGTYYENINFNGKNITIESSDGADFTIIDGNENGSVVRICNYEDTTAVLRGFTIMNGNGTDSGYSNYSGGGIYCKNSTPKLENLIIRDNSANASNIEYGGGEYIVNMLHHIY